MDILSLVKIENFSAQDTIKRMKTSCRQGENICKKIWKILISKIYKELIQLTMKITIKKLAKYLKRGLIKEDI